MAETDLISRIKEHASRYPAFDADRDSFVLWSSKAGELLDEVAVEGTPAPRSHVAGSAGTVPEDIRQAAQKAWDDAMALTSDAQSEMVIAQAILAERQARPLQHVMGSIETLKAVRQSIKNARGAIESGQVVDKDVHGTLTRAIRIIDAALSAPEAEG